ncbi:helix-turn-helix domain-containing protein [Pedobacter namyangjuensis]|uniref:helix-turn-helix domain-containing protein n=1 Tax=Pedobacter namyangjuensis TaxID=600626 RepID=UPI000DE534CB|nr:helix-turn-helix domain-containing protein [Pedobacter namyangjuensis]
MYVELLKNLEILIGIQRKMLSLLAKGATETMVVQEELLDATDIKKLLHISNSTLYRLRKKKQLKCKLIAGKWYYYKSSVLADPDNSI